MPDPAESVALPAASNPLQHWFLQRSLPRYAKLPPELRPVAIERDRFLTSGRSAGLWIGMACAIAGSTYGLAAQPEHISGWLAFLFAFGTVAGLFKAGVSAWLRPHRFRGRRLWRIFFLVLIATYAGAIASFGGRLHTMVEQGMPWHDALWRVVWRATPLQFIVFAGALILLATIASARQQFMRRELESARVERERDAVLQQATQARLSLLQAQIQPHFLFNTLAALQHWVDGGDPRAAPLLRSLTAFLRGSTERMLEAQVTLAQECEMVGHYLEIMRARLGERLRYRIELDPTCAALVMPPGLVVTLVENAIEHGIEPQLRGGEVLLLVRREGERCELRVLDDGAGLADDARDGVGLANSRERLRHALGASAELNLRRRDDGPGTEACIRWQAPPG